MEQIVNYFIKEKNTTKVVANILTKNLVKYKDICEEFLYWIEKRDFNFANAVEIEGYTAKKINEIAPFLDGAGIYNFMVTLREEPEKAHEYIKNGFPRK